MFNDRFLGSIDLHQFFATVNGSHVPKYKLIISNHKTIQLALINECVKTAMTLALPVHWNPSPSYPTSHEHVNDPSVLLHVALLPQGEF